VLRAACVQPVEHYRLDVGLLRPGDPADMIVVDSLERLRVTRTVIDGNLVAADGETLIPDLRSESPNRFSRSRVAASDFSIEARSETARVIEALDGQLVTNCIELDVTTQHGRAVSDPSRDVLKLAVVNRYAEAPPAVAFIRNIGLKRGAIASSVAHDSHNIIVVGVTDVEMAAAANEIIAYRGGLSLADGSSTNVIPLPIAGLMSDADGYEVAAAYTEMDAKAKEMGSPLRAPYMTLSFMALLVIPALKLSDRGLFDGLRFEFVDIFV
ncbi:MAG: adenine deaminase C-terminal domain-containing protein, partial [Rhodothermales bacterium]|nr:adenine deaminase C-terminal domain-containing protein [Rhodothermales bacterium]